MRLTFKELEINKAKFIDLLRSTKRSGIDAMIAALENSTFFTDPASAKFHGNFEGGLCLHSLKVYENYVKLTNKEDETAIISCLLHDVCKAGTYKKIYTNDSFYFENQSSNFPLGHGEKSVYLISKYIILTNEEALMIRWHMGAYEGNQCWRELGEAQRMYKSVLYIHFADMIASTIQNI